MFAVNKMKTKQQIGGLRKADVYKKQRKRGPDMLILLKENLKYKNNCYNIKKKQQWQKKLHNYV